MLTRLGHTIRLSVCVCVLANAANAHAADQQDRIQRVVQDLKARLSIAQTVDVAIVRANPKLFSVVPVERQRSTFLLSVEEDFAVGLTDVELRAAVAHELGHVWIFTHFPFLQTEQLANDIAARVVSRDSLTPLYDKVWKKVGAD
jgi:hypothetical protein